MIGWPSCFGSVVRQYIMLGIVWWNRIALLMVWAAKRKTGRDQGLSVSSKGCPDDLTSSQLGFISERFYYLPTVSQVGDQAFNLWTFQGHSRFNQ